MDRSHQSQKDNRWNAEMTLWTKEIEEGNEKGGGVDYNSTGAMWTGTLKHDTKTIRGNMLRLSSCSGLIMAEHDNEDSSY